ncbi:LytR/AlgR family response regulator transcription factor [Lutispora thermophila]|uniref:Stage 0 sporulation protein A homolog n=1 Tax=Lutispora thermophila DSM 19022 TaxID=1122184 RepID=A0A1M6IN92_9FIRM|nr:LytTR family DNA-binding domain-containing protein [Lutispora thermophila]SHJ35819.1 two component transcriptional regulator, LytTR family [Lutispora thermophila DSM 19022]
MHLNVFLCDDDHVQLNTLSSFINSLCSDHDVNVIHTTCGEELLKKVHTVKPDIVFLDIEMEGINGIETGIKLREHFNDVIIVYITGYSNYALDAFRVKSFDYLIKPVTLNRFEVLMKDIFVRLEEIRTYKEKNGIFHVNNKDAYVAIKYDDIICFEKVFRKIKVYTKDTSYEFYGTLADLIKKLDLNIFAQCHQGYIVNINKIKELKIDKISFHESSLEVPVSRKYKSSIKKIFEERLFS